jgi:hypothetical protein
MPNRGSPFMSTILEFIACIKIQNLIETRTDVERALIIDNLSVIFAVKKSRFLIGNFEWWLCDKNSCFFDLL